MFEDQPCDCDLPVKNPKRGANIADVIEAFHSGIEFTPKSTTQKQSIELFDKILTEAKPLDFLVLAYSDNPDKLELIQILRHNQFDLSLEPLSRDNAQKTLVKMQPKDRHKLIIVVEEISQVMEMLQERISLFPEGVLRYYSEKTKYWKLLDEASLNILLPEFAIRCGIDRLEAYDEKNVKSMRNQFYNIATVIVHNNVEDENIVRINLNNGVYVFSKDFRGLVPHDPNYFFKYTLTFDYDPQATAPRYLQFLDEVQEEKEAQMVMSESVALALTKLNLHKCLLLVGSGLNGKSSWTDIISGVLGIENVCALTLSNVASNRSDAPYNRALLKDYLINMVTEMDAKDCNSDTVKTLIAREPIQARNPFGRPFIISKYATMIFCCNDLPRSSDNSPGFYRRWLVLNFLNQIAEDKIEIDLAERIIANERAGVFNWILEGVERLLKNKNFTFSPKIDKATKRFRIESDIIALFIDINRYKKSETYIIGSEMYADFVKFNEDNGINRKCTRILFYKRLENLGFEVKRHATDNAIWVYATNRQDQKSKEVDAKLAEMGIIK